MSYRTDFEDFGVELRGFIRACSPAGGSASLSTSTLAPPVAEEDLSAGSRDRIFNELACRLFALQFRHNSNYQKVCCARGVTPTAISHWCQVPAIPTAAFKEMAFSCVPEGERCCVFHSSGTTGQAHSRHFHNEASLAIYEDSLLPWFGAHLRPEPLRSARKEAGPGRLLCLTPPAAQAPHSSLVYMFEAVRRHFAWEQAVFLGKVAQNGDWVLELPAVRQELIDGCAKGSAIVLLGTAFSFVHLLDDLIKRQIRLELPAGSRVMETGGYKGRSRTLRKEQLYGLLTRHLGVPAWNIISEYGMSELSSQAYDLAIGVQELTLAQLYRGYRFPPWARARLVSPETGSEVLPGESGLIQVFDLANVYSVMAIQTEDLGIRGPGGFELLGRSPASEPRGCSLMPA
jgi:Acyl-protein synthetase, LuxE